MLRAAAVCCTATMILGLWHGSVGASGTPTDRCVAARNTAAAKAFGCLVKGNNKILKGGDSDLTVCSHKLGAALAKAESIGDCPTATSNLENDRIAPALTDMLTSLGVEMAPGNRCIREKSTAIGKHAACMARAFGTQLAGTPADFAVCALRLQAAFLKAESRGSCLTMGDADAVALVASAVWTNLAYGDLTGVQLDHYDLTHADLIGTNLDNASLIGVNLSYLIATDGSLRGADLTGATLDLSNFSRTDLSGAKLTNASLLDTGFLQAHLTGADLTDASLVGAGFLQADLTDATLTGADLYAVQGVDLVGCPAALPPAWACVKNNLAGPGARLYFADLAGASLAGMDLSEAALSSADLTGADLSGVNLDVGSVMWANLTDTILAGATLTYTNFGGATLTNTDLSHANLADAGFYDVAALVNIIWDQTTCSDGSVSDTNGTSPESCCGHLIPAFPSGCSP